MTETDKLEITVGKIKRLAEGCPQAQSMLEAVFPEAFESEWEDVTEQLRMEWDEHGGCYDIHLFEEGGEEVGWIYPGEGVELSTGGRKRYRVETIQLSFHNFIRILRRKT